MALSGGNPAVVLIVVIDERWALIMAATWSNSFREARKILQTSTWPIRVKSAPIDSTDIPAQPEALPRRAELARESGATGDAAASRSADVVVGANEVLRGCDEARSFDADLRGAVCVMLRAYARNRIAIGAHGEGRAMRQDLRGHEIGPDRYRSNSAEATKAIGIGWMRIKD